MTDKKEEIIYKINESNLFNCRETTYKEHKHKEKYGKSFRATTKNDEFVYCKCNGMEFRVSAIEEDFGHILFLYNFTQLKIRIEDIENLNFFKY